MTLEPLNQTKKNKHLKGHISLHMHKQGNILSHDMQGHMPQWICLHLKYKYRSTLLVVVIDNLLPDHHRNLKFQRHKSAI